MAVLKWYIRKHVSQENKTLQQRRLHREKRKGELEGCEKKLANANFVDKAPEAVVDKVRTRASELQSAIASLEEQQRRIQAL